MPTMLCRSISGTSSVGWVDALGEHELRARRLPGALVDLPVGPRRRRRTPGGARGRRRAARGSRDPSGRRRAGSRRRARRRPDQARVVLRRTEVASRSLYCDPLVGEVRPDPLFQLAAARPVLGDQQPPVAMRLGEDRLDRLARCTARSPGRHADVDPWLARPRPGSTSAAVRVAAGQSQGLRSARSGPLCRDGGRSVRGATGQARSSARQGRGPAHRSRRAVEGYARRAATKPRDDLAADRDATRRSSSEQHSR